MRTSIVPLAVAVLTLASPFTAWAGSASAGFTVSVTVLPTREQGLKSAEITLRQADGTSVVLDPQLCAEYARDPASIARHVRPSAGGQPLVTVVY